MITQRAGSFDVKPMCDAQAVVAVATGWQGAQLVAYHEVVVADGAGSLFLQLGDRVLVAHLQSRGQSRFTPPVKL